ncbi:hypothetical protein [Psychrobacter sp. FME61]|uniref:hypothetical protein n=1 Tax=unclassified Psychrobacter TaxID=196806 RepID=UPI0018668B43|nr:hypothetical protein [Psychrobacter sp. FME61]
MSRIQQKRMSKRTLEQWLSEYSVSHQNLVNKKIRAFPKKCVTAYNPLTGE